MSAPSPFSEPRWVLAETLAFRAQLSGGPHRFWSLHPDQRRKYLTEADALVEALAAAGCLARRTAADRDLAEVARISAAIHAAGIADGRCVSGKTGKSDHLVAIHDAESRYVVGFPPVSSPHVMDDSPLYERADELRAFRKQYLEGNL